MLAPHELKNKTFSKAVRGYNPTEVSEYIEFMVEKYTEIYRANNELERKLKLVAAKLEEIKEDEESIRNTLLKAQKMGEQIISEASKRADGITASVQERCDAIIEDFKEQARDEKDELWKIRTFVLDFKRTLFDAYREHIQSLQAISVNDIEDIVMPDEEKLAETILNEVKKASKENKIENTDKKANALEKKTPNIEGEAKKKTTAETIKIVPDQTAFEKNKEENKVIQDQVKKVKETKKDSDADPFIEALEQTAEKS